MEILSITPLNKDQEIIVAKKLLLRMLRGQLQHFLRKNDIPNRTKIYKDLTDNWFPYNNEEDYNIKLKARTKVQKEHLEFILELVPLSNIIIHFLESNSIDIMLYDIRENELGFRFDFTIKLGNYSKSKEEEYQKGGIDDGRVL